MRIKMDNPNEVFTIIVGAGMSGITLAARLLNSGVLKRGEFVLVDRWADYGGVWESNKYPGAACDVPSHAYVLPFHLNPSESSVILLHPTSTDQSQSVVPRICITT
jgi:cation diffusion facilitator CzcD-associated flavoprotein CzcO